MWGTLLGKRTRLKVIVGSVVALAGALLVADFASAATITVTTGLDLFNATPGQGCSLRDAIQAANTDTAFGDCSAGSGADTIVFTPTLTKVMQTNTNSLSGNNDDNSYLDLDIVADDASASGGVTLTIDGGPTGVVIEGDQSGWADRIFDIVISNTGATPGGVVLRNLTIQGGGKTLPLADETGSGSFCFQGGGGVRSASGVTVTLESVTVQDNTMPRAGGGVCHNGGAPLIVDGSVITNNLVVDTVPVGARGGGVAMGGGGSVTLTGTQVLSNSASSTGNGANAYGGGVYVADSSVLTVTNSSVVSNTSIADDAGAGGSILAQGGGVWTGSSSSQELIDSRIEGNVAEATLSGSSGFSADAYGGGVYAGFGSTQVLTGAQVLSNSASSTGANANAYGGGVYVADSSVLTVTNSSVLSNTSIADDAGVGGTVFA
ncbi:MAG: CSLREA domain-containing protein, partial [Thermoflexales bacterium]